MKRAFLSISLLILLAGVASRVESAPRDEPDAPRETAAGEDVNAQVELGKRYLEGRDVPVDIAKGRALLLDAADQGHPTAPFLIASSYLFVEEPPNLIQGFAWLRVASSPGLPDAAFANHLAAEISTQLTQPQRDQAEALAEENLKRFKVRAAPPSTR